MAKLETCVFMLLATFLAVEGIMIPPPTPRQIGKFFPTAHIPTNITPNDPRCKENGVFANLNDCTAYYACHDGTSQDRKCPHGMRFDTIRRCSMVEDPDCGKPSHSSTKPRLECPSDYGIFPYKEDCHQYIVCVDAVPDLRKCPEGQWYSHNVGCIEGTACPKPQNAHSVCRRADSVYPELSDCRKYVKCTNWVPEFKTCPEGELFDKHKKRCWKAEEVTCRSNDVSEVMERI